MDFSASGICRSCCCCCLDSSPEHEEDEEDEEEVLSTSTIHCVVLGDVGDTTNGVRRGIAIFHPEENDARLTCMDAGAFSCSLVGDLRRFPVPEFLPCMSAMDSAIKFESWIGRIERYNKSLLVEMQRSSLLASVIDFVRTEAIRAFIYREGPREP